MYLPRQGDLSGKRLFKFTGLIALCLCGLLNPIRGLAQDSDRCSLIEGEQVSPSLVTLTMHADHSRYRHNAPLEVTLTLKAGSNGVYLPAYFGDFMKTCEHGFSATILTKAGKLADRHPSGCVRDDLRDGSDTAQAELKNFVHLKPGESRTWHTTLKTASLSRGRYRLYGEYISFAYMIDEVGRLPQVGGSMAKGRITAAPISIDLR